MNGRAVYIKRLYHEYVALKIDRFVYFPLRWFEVFLIHLSCGIEFGRCGEATSESYGCEAVA